MIVYYLFYSLIPFTLAGVPDEITDNDHLPVRGHLYGGFHEKDLQFHKWSRGAAHNWYVVIKNK